MLLRSHGISHPTIDRSRSTSSALLSDVIRGSQVAPVEVKQETSNDVFISNHPGSHSHSLTEELLDDSSAVSGMDPMLSDLVDTATVSMDDVNMIH